MQKHYYHVDNPDRIYRVLAKFKGSGELKGQKVIAYTDDRTGESYCRLASEWSDRMRPAQSPVLSDDVDPVTELSLDRFLSQLRFNPRGRYELKLLASSYQMANIFRPLLYVLTATSNASKSIETTAMGPEHCVVSDVRSVVDKAVMLTTTEEVLGGLVPFKHFLEWGLPGVHPDQRAALHSLLHALNIGWPITMVSTDVKPYIPGKVRVLRVSPRIRLAETRPDQPNPRWLTIDIPYSW